MQPVGDMDLGSVVFMLGWAKCINMGNEHAGQTEIQPIQLMHGGINQHWASIASGYTRVDLPTTHLAFLGYVGFEVNM